MLGTVCGEVVALPKGSEVVISDKHNIFFPSDLSGYGFRIDLDAFSICVQIQMLEDCNSKEG